MKWHDFIKLANEVDKKKFINEYLKWGERLREAYQETSSLDKIYRKIVIVGMGGSGIVGDILRDYVILSRYPIDIYVYKGSYPPKRILRNSLLIGISHSGNTRETIEMVKYGSKYSREIVVVTSGGKLAEYADDNKWIKVVIKPALAPRAGLPQMIGSTLKLLSKSLRIGKKVMRASNKLSKEIIKINLSRRYNEAYKYAKSIWGSIPIFYGKEGYKGVLHRIKSSFNENSKIHVYYALIPEAYHNEIEAYETYDQFIIPILLDDGDPIFSYMKNYFEIHNINYMIYNMKHKDLLSRILSTVLFFDIVSIYIAYLRHIDPYEINAINEIKNMKI